MRKFAHLFLLLGAVIAATSCTVSGAAAGDTGEPVVLADESGPRAAIVLADAPRNILITTGRKRKGTFRQFTVRYAAEELQKYVEKSTGAKLPIVRASEAPEEGALVLVGQSPLTDKLGISRAGLKPEGFRIAARGRSVAIVGEVAPAGGYQAGYDRGTLWGVYEFLERFVGARWYLAGELGTVIPERKTLAVPPTDFTKAPCFAKRIGSISESYSDATKLEWYPVFRHGDTTGFAANHTYYFWARLFGKTHPEYFGVDANGKRMFDTKKLSNKKLIPKKLLLT